MKKKIEYIIDSLIIAIFVVYTGYLFNAWICSPYPPGVATINHMYRIKFISDHLPHFRSWSHHWNAGSPLFKWYPLLPYVLPALVSKVTHFPIGSILVSFLAMSYITMGLGVYYFTREIGGSRGVSLVAAFLTASTPTLWSMYLGGGDDGRVLSAVFLPFCLWATAKLSRKIAKNKHTRRTYISTVLLISVAMSFHPYYGVPTFFSSLFLLFFSLKDWKQKVYAIIIICVPVLLLNAHFYIPIIYTPPAMYRAKLLLPYAASSIDLLLKLPARAREGRWIPALSPVVLPLTALLLLARFRFKTIKTEQDKYVTILGFLTSFSVLFIVVGRWLLIGPEEALRLLPFYLMPFNGIMLNQICNAIFQNRKRIPSLISATIILVIVISSTLVARLPMLVVPSVEPVQSTSLRQLSVPDKENAFRVKAPSGVEVWFNYEYDVPQATGMYGFEILYPSWISWLQSIIEKPDNYNETNFFLDWWSIKWILTSRAHVTEKFLRKPEQYVFESMAAPAHIYQFNYSTTPIISATNVPTTLIIAHSISYDEIFHNLSHSNHNSRCFIPIRGSQYVDDYTLTELSQFDVIVIYNYEYHDRAKAWSLLKEYVENGGGLVIDTGCSPDISISHIPLPCPIERTTDTNFNKDWQFTYVDNPITLGIDFSSFSPALLNVSGKQYPWGVSTTYNDSVRTWAKPVLWGKGHPLIVIGTYGKGRIVWSGLNLPYHINSYTSYQESLFLYKILDWASKASGKRAVNVNYTVDRPHSEKVVVAVKNESSGVLFKEFYFKNWRANLIDTYGKRHRLDIYRAGPDFMYVSLPQDTKFPITVVLKYGMTWDEWFGRITSLTALIILTTYAIRLPIDRPAKSLIKKINEKRKKWWYKE